MEHPYDGSWGYQTLGYFAATSPFGTPAEFMEFVDGCHQARPPASFSTGPPRISPRYSRLAQFDGSISMSTPTRPGRHPDWGTLVFNYGPHRSPELSSSPRALLARTNTTSTAFA